jgi:hypothetical protein
VPSRESDGASAHSPEALRSRIRDQLLATADSELLVDVMQVHLDGALTHEQLFCNVAIAPARGDQLQDLDSRAVSSRDTSRRPASRVSILAIA